MRRRSVLSIATSEGYERPCHFRRRVLGLGGAPAAALAWMETPGRTVDSVVMGSFLRRLRRVVFAVLAVLAVLLGLAAAVITQPTLVIQPAPRDLQASPERLRRHVEFLSVAASPRDSDHPQTLDKAAVYVREQFLQVGARSASRRFRSEDAPTGTSPPRSVPRPVQLLVVGAHYDSIRSETSAPTPERTMSRFVLTSAARADLIEISDYISKDSSGAARRVRQELVYSSMSSKRVPSPSRASCRASSILRRNRGSFSS